MSVNKTILKKIIINLKKGVNGSPEFTSYIQRNFNRYNTEIIIAVQMVMFNRTYDEAVNILLQEITQSN